MKNKFVLIIALCLLVIACQTVERSERPDDLIGENKMVEVLTELALLQSARNLNRGVLEEAGIAPEDYIYNKYHIDSLQFQQSNDYYTENFTDYEHIYERVRDRLEAIKKIRDSINVEEERRQDSIAKQDSIRQDSITRVGDTIERDSLKKIYSN